MTFGERIRILREKKGLTQVQAAKFFNITNSQLSRYEKNVTTPDQEILKQLADFYKVTTDYLLGRESKYQKYNSNMIKEGIPYYVTKLESLSENKKKVVIELIEMLEEE